MAWHRHREKRTKQSKKKNATNIAAKRNLKTLIKQLLQLIKDKKVNESKDQLKKIIKASSTMAKRGIIHKNNASRHISRLTKKVNGLILGKTVSDKQ